MSTATSHSSVSSSEGSHGSLFSEDEAKFMNESFHSADQFDPFTLGAPGFKVPSNLPHQRSLSPNSNPNPNHWSNNPISTSTPFTAFSPPSASSTSTTSNSNPHPRSISHGSSSNNRFSCNEMMPPHHLTSNHSNPPPTSTSTTTNMTSTPFYSADVDHHLSPNSSANSSSPPNHNHHPQQSFSSIHARHNSVGGGWNNHHQNNINYNSNHQPQPNQTYGSWFHLNHQSNPSPHYPNPPSTAPPQPPSTAYGSQWAIEQLNFLQSESQKFSNRPRAESSTSSNHSNSVHSGEGGDSSNGMVGNPNGSGNHFSQSLQMPTMNDDHHRRHSLAGYVNQNHPPPNAGAAAAPPVTSSSSSSFNTGFSESNNPMDMITPQITPQPTGNGRGFNSNSTTSNHHSVANPRDSEKDLSMLGLSFPSSHTFPSMNNNNDQNPNRQGSPFSKRPRDDVEMRDSFGENKRGRNSNAEASGSNPPTWNWTSSTGTSNSMPNDPSSSNLKQSNTSRSKSPTKRTSTSPSNNQRNSNAQATSSSSSAMPTSWSLMSYSTSDSLQGSEEGLRLIPIDPERGRNLIPNDLEDYFWTRKFDKRQPHLEDLKRKEMLEKSQNGGGGGENENANGKSSNSKGKGKASNNNADKEKPALLTEAEKKANHIASEQKRRANIRKGYEMLCNIIPPLREALEREKSKGGGARRGGMAFTGMVNVNSNSIKNNNNGSGSGDDNDKKGKKSSKDDQEDGLEIEGEKIDGRAGPRSEGIVLMKCE